MRKKELIKTIQAMKEETWKSWLLFTKYGNDLMAEKMLSKQVAYTEILKLLGVK